MGVNGKVRTDHDLHKGSNLGMGVYAIERSYPKVGVGQIWKQYLKQLKQEDPPPHPPRPASCYVFSTHHDKWTESWKRVTKRTFLPSNTEIGPVVSDKKIFKVFCIAI